jgi:hypothetical protein
MGGVPYPGYYPAGIYFYDVDDRVPVTGTRGSLTTFY